MDGEGEVGKLAVSARGSVAGCASVCVSVGRWDKLLIDLLDESREVGDTLGDVACVHEVEVVLFCSLSEIRSIVFWSREKSPSCRSREAQHRQLRTG